MKLLSYLSADGGGLPQPADERRLAVGSEAWSEALASAGGDPLSDRARQWSTTPTGDRLLAAIFGNSPYLSSAAIKEWPFLTSLVEVGPDRLLSEIAADIESTEDRGEDTPTLMRRLRVAKRRVALLAAVAELAGVWALEQQTGALSRLAEAVLGAALRHLLREAARKQLILLPASSEPEQGSGLIVIGMGKLGAHELNYSSDIDLIVLYDPAVARVTARAGIQSFFVRLTRDLVRILEEHTAEGYLFRTDLRLRPDPAATPLAISVVAALGYYESVGQNWERAALIKARPVAGDGAAGERFLRELRPFLWRKNLDFAAIQDIHSIKRQINAYRGGARIAVEGHDIKTGRGGIREIEFFAQTQQLIWGGRLRELRTGSTCEALRRLASTGRIYPATAAELIDNYRFLRRLEHRLQMVEDAQTHMLPPDPAGIARIGVFLGYPQTDAFVADLLRHLSSVERHYAELFEQAPSLSGPGNLVFTGVEDDAETLRTLSWLGFAEPATDTALLRFDQFLSRLPAGVQLFSLFHANPGLLELVAEIMAGAPRLAEQLAQRPALLDAVLTEGFFAPPPGPNAFAADLGQVLGGARDYEETLDALRRWAGERRFQVGVQLLRRALDGRQAGEVLADIAETALTALLPTVEAEFARRHGRVQGSMFAAIGMGRLGSREMTLASDLDLILIYDVPPGSETSDGPHPLPVASYYARLTQRLIGAITAPTAEGRLYEVDMRLRPSGASGPIASNLAGFARYQRESAWTWEHMALTRARPVGGDPALCVQIADAIGAVLGAKRDARRLLVDVADMRRRIADENPRPTRWDLKNRRGGLIDLEFIVQYLVLREAASSPQLLCRGTEQALRALGEADVLAPQARQELLHALALLRHVQALLTLLRGGLSEEEALSEVDAATVARCAGAVDFAGLDADISAAAGRVRGWYRRLIEKPARRAARQIAEHTGDSAG